MNIDWMWLLIGAALGYFFGGRISGAVGSLKSKATG